METPASHGDGRGQNWSGVVWAYLVITAVGALALAQSWNRWLHPVIDAGRDLYLPEQIRYGFELYRDAAYYYPPFSAYALALITSVTGASLAAYAGIGIAVSVVVVATIFAIARKHSGLTPALVAGLVFVSVCMTGATAYGSNFIFPYAGNAVFGMTLFLLFEGAVLATLRFGATKGRTWTAVVCASLCSLTKIEFATFVIATIVVWPIVVALTRTGAVRDAARAIFLGLSGIAAVWLACWLYFLDAGRMGSTFLSDVFPSSLLSGPVARAFYAKVAGTDQVAINLSLAVAGALGVTAYAFFLRMLDKTVAIEKAASRRLSTAATLFGIGLLAWFLGTDLFFRAWTILQLALVPLAARDLISMRREPGNPRHVVMPALLWFSLCASSRIPLELAPVWYGFFLILPVLLLVVHVLFAYLPERGVYSKTAALMWLPLLLVICGRNLVDQRNAYARKTFAIESPRGTLFDYSSERATTINELLAHASKTGMTGLVVIPEGLTINYLASLRNPTRYHTFTPAEMPTQESEIPIIADFERVRPRHVAVTTQQAAAFGPLQFGTDYGRDLYRYLTSHYVLEREWRTSTFSLFLLRRIDETDVTNDESSATP